MNPPWGWIPWSECGQIAACKERHLLGKGGISPTLHPTHRDVVARVCVLGPVVAEHCQLQGCLSRSVAMYCEIPTVRSVGYYGGPWCIAMRCDAPRSDAKCCGARRDGKETLHRVISLMALHVLLRLLEAAPVSVAYVRNSRPLGHVG